MRSSRLGLVALTLLALTAACTGGGSPQRARLSGGVEPPPELATQPEPSTPPTTAMSASAVVLAADGLGPLAFGTQAARSMEALTQAFGRAETIVPLPAGSTCAATRTFHWKGFAVWINEVTGQSGGSPGLVGWSLTAPAPAGLKTATGIGMGSTAGAIKAAYGSAATRTGSTMTITASNGTITADLAGASDSSPVKAMHAGVTCTS
jgi:hypothetical protein